MRRDRCPPITTALSFCPWRSRFLLRASDRHRQQAVGTVSGIERQTASTRPTSRLSYARNGSFTGRIIAIPGSMGTALQRIARAGPRLAQSLRPKGRCGTSTNRTGATCDRTARSSSKDGTKAAFPAASACRAGRPQPFARPCRRVANGSAEPRHHCRMPR